MTLQPTRMKRNEKKTFNFKRKINFHSFKWVFHCYFETTINMNKSGFKLQYFRMRRKSVINTINFRVWYIYSSYILYAQNWTNKKKNKQTYCRYKINNNNYVGECNFKPTPFNWFYTYENINLVNYSNVTFFFVVERKKVLLFLDFYF